MPPSMQPRVRDLTCLLSTRPTQAPSELIRRPRSLLFPLSLTSYEPHHLRPRPLSQDTTRTLRACPLRSAQGAGWLTSSSLLSLPSLLSILIRSWKWFEYLWKLRTAFCGCYGHQPTSLTIFLGYPRPHSSPSLLQSITLRPPPPGSLL